MTRSEQFSQNLLAVLDQIQEQQLYTPKNKAIQYPIGTEDDLALLEMLESWKVITVTNPTPDKLELKTVSEKFKELHKIVKNANSEKVDSISLRGIIDEWSTPFPTHERFGFDIWQLKKDRVPKKKVLTNNDISYNEKTGIGRVGEKKFKFKDHQPEYRIFAKLYENINKKLNRYDVLELAHFYEEGEDPDPARKNAETETINEIAKSLRKKTGLNTEQLVMNNGNLTLVGNKI